MGLLAPGKCRPCAPIDITDNSQIAFLSLARRFFRDLRNEVVPDRKEGLLNVSDPMACSKVCRGFSPQFKMNGFVSFVGNFHAAYDPRHGGQMVEYPRCGPLSCFK